ncbi:H/ACA ribonucleoprotein complex subunit 2-like protein [Entamoeba marina]
MSSDKSNTHLIPIATPLASDKMEKKLHRVIKKAVDDKCIKRGIKDTIKSTRKESADIMKGWLCVIAGDVTPLDVISHIPSYMKEKGIAYIYVKTREDLGKVCGSKHPTTCVLITPSTKDSCYSSCHKLVKKIKSD